MLNVSFFTFNAFAENTYLLVNEKKECWIVDPGMYDTSEVESIMHHISEKQLIPQGIINTHAHIDHIFGVMPLKNKYNIPFRIHKKEIPVLQSAATSALMFGFSIDGQPIADNYIDDSNDLLLGEDTIKVLFTPGHSPGSVSFYYAPGNWVISGDVLFSEGIGRTDLPGGNYDTLIESINSQLFKLPGRTTVLPGHGPSTTIEHEKENNPFLR